MNWAARYRIARNAEYRPTKQQSPRVTVSARCGSRFMMLRRETR